MTVEVQPGASACFVPPARGPPLVGHPSPYPFPNEGVPMRKLVIVPAVLALALATSVSVAAVGRDKTVAMVGEEKFVPNRIFSSNFRFDPRTIRVASGETVTWVNDTDAPHTVTVVADTPDDFAELFFCREPGGECRAAIDAHFATTPPTFVVNAGAAGLDAAGDSLLVLDPGGSISEVVSAPSGSTLEYICAIHPWMQARIRVA
jgi:plastocyanin